MADGGRIHIQDALSLVGDLPLPHPASALLSSFVLEARNPEVAAEYVQRQIADGQAHLLVSDWISIVNSITDEGLSPPQPNVDTIKAITRRDGYKCCVSGKSGGFWDPLIVVPILPIPYKWASADPRVLQMLNAFFGRPYLEWWRNCIERAGMISSYHNHWLVRKSVSEALKRGVVRLVRRPSSMIEYEVDHVLIGNERPIAISGKYALLGDHSRSGIDKVDARFIGTHARLCRSIQLVNIARSMTPSLLSQESPKPIPKSHQTRIRPRTRLNQTRLLSPFLHIWLLLPATARIAVYELLRKLGHRLYGLDDADNVQRLPFGLYLKYRGEPDLQRNEFHALKMIQQHTTIPAPRALDIVSKNIPNANDDFDPSPTSVSYLLITRVPGITLAQGHDALSDQDFQTISLQMKHYISQIRDIPKIVNPQMAICNTLGEACRDHRIKYADPIGPFPDEASFSQQLRYSDEPSRRGHRIVFTHADLNPRNILVDKVHYEDGSHGWQISGILDWETAGYYPEYWDFTKAMYEGFRWPKRYNDVVKDIFAEFGEYSRELEVEKRSWESGDG
ncbi:hypothetical protein J3459_002474 [Metarhizium acridum]|nr:hypothetical protein J3459_002474 [Metarhizium acridum]